jgi:hypothetical protein
MTSFRSKWTTAAAIAMFGLASAAQPAFSQIGPKNLMSPTYRTSAVQAEVPQGLTKKEAKKLAATAESRTDHLKLAEYYTMQADRLEARAAGYEQAAAAYRDGPTVKNLMAPTTAERYEFFVKGFREEANANRVLAETHGHLALIAGL